MRPTGQLSGELDVPHKKTTFPTLRLGFPVVHFSSCIKVFKYTETKRIDEVVSDSAIDLNKLNCHQRFFLEEQAGVNQLRSDMGLDNLNRHGGH